MFRNDPYTGKPIQFKAFKGEPGYAFRANQHRLSCGCICNERGDADDRRQIVADLLANDASPFVPDDEDSLRMMSDATLRKMRDQYAVSANEEVDDEDRLTTIKQMIANSLDKHVGGDLKQLQQTLRTRPSRSSSVQADDDEDIRAMTMHTSSVVAFRAMRGEKPGVDPLLEAQARMHRNLDAMARGILPDEHGMRGVDVVALNDDEAEAMIAPSSLSVFNAMKGK